MTSTQRVEGINGIIKKYVNSKSNLTEVFKGIHEFLCNQTAKAELVLLTDRIRSDLT